MNLREFVVDFDLSRARALWADIQQTGLRTLTTRHRRKDGTTFPVEARIGAIVFDQRNLILAQVRDMTERNQAEAAIRESEERFRQVVENIEEVFWMTDVAQSRLLYISPGYQRIWGRSPDDLYQSLESWIVTIHPEDRERVRRQWREDQVAGAYNVEYRIVRPDNSVRWIQDKAYPVRDASGACTRIVGVASDITEQRQLEAQVRQAQKMDAIGTLAGGIAHDFNNILGAILGFTELARFRLGENSAVRTELEGVLEGARRASGLVGQILAFSRRQDPRRVPVQLSQVVAESLRLLRATIPAGIEFDVQLPPDLPPIHADPDQIHQVIMNLGTNAYQAIGRQNGRISVAAETTHTGPLSSLALTGIRPGPYIHISFTDTGCGIPREVLDRVFEPFFTTKPLGEGTGLGLSVVHGIMKAHDGAITVYSQPGRGTTFHLYFPCSANGKSVKMTAESPPQRGCGEMILVLDDERPLAQLGKQLLESLGYQAVAFTEPAAAFAEIEANPASYRLLITDLSMPGMNGLHLARQVHARLPHLPILLMTGFLGGIHQEDLRHTGIRQTLGKPFTTAALALAVHRCLSPTSPGETLPTA
jgi:PAS domain S-box-containing protein